MKIWCLTCNTINSKWVISLWTIKHLIKTQIIIMRLMHWNNSVVMNSRICSSLISFNSHMDNRQIKILNRINTIISIRISNRSNNSLILITNSNSRIRIINISNHINRIRNNSIALNKIILSISIYINLLTISLILIL